MLQYHIKHPCHEIKANNYVSVYRTVEAYCTSLAETLAITNAPNFSQLEVHKDGPGPDQLHPFTLQVLVLGLSFISHRDTAPIH